ncbi:putative sporulation protein YtxC [Paenibacillus dakarensis]|uniref:putative sporulation protein YtxC n=1 Tax=Paenibacillus dakarensis TaxID=1527293 RepID=UPI0006D52B47|nr:putative sporulation protein YtxC [Paenibacillus dakarensis]
MELFSISVDTQTDGEKEVFHRIFSDKQKELHKQCRQLKFSFSASGNRVTWICSGKLPLTSWTASAEKVRLIVSEAAAAYILRVKEKTLAAGLLLKEFEFHDEEEAERVLQWFLTLLAKDDDLPDGYSQQRRQKLKDSIYASLYDSPDLNLNGYMTFRMGAYMQELREMAEYAVDEFMLDQQYEEFVSLLKYFVYFQEPLMPLVHVIHKGNEEFLLLDGNLKPIEKARNDGLVMERLDQEMEMEDMVVSTLISVSPARMIIHTREPHLPVIGTLAHIFDNRAEICCSCPECSSILENAANDNLTFSVKRDYNN